MPRYSHHSLIAKYRSKCPAIFGLLLVVTLGGCMTDRDTTGSIATSALPRSESSLRDYAADWGRRHEADPSDKTASINYARALRGLTQYAQAAAVLEAAAIKNPRDLVILSAYGKALSDAGRLKEAAAVLSRAHTPEHPDWTILSAQGAIAEQLGDHDAAMGYYDAALKIAPGEPLILSNQGLSYALAKQLPQAEDCLRRAASSERADQRVRQNFALVLALEGKFGEAEGVARRDMPPADAEASIEAIRAMIAQSDTWGAIRKPAPSKKTALKNASAG